MEVPSCGSIVPVSLSPASRFGAGQGLQKASAMEAANYGFHVASGIERSPVIDALGGQRDEQACDQINDIRREAGVVDDNGISLPIEKFTTDHFLALTRLTQQKNVGNCLELSLLAARAMVENGYPSDIQLLAIQPKTGSLQAGDFDHCILRVRANDGAAGSALQENWIVDALLGKIPAETCIEQTGSRREAVYEEPQVERHGVAVVHEEGHPRLMSFDREKMDAFLLGTVSCTGDGIAQVRRVQFLPYVS